MSCDGAHRIEAHVAGHDTDAGNIQPADALASRFVEVLGDADEPVAEPLADRLADFQRLAADKITKLDDILIERRKTLRVFMRDFEHELRIDVNRGRLDS